MQAQRHRARAGGFVTTCFCCSRFTWKWNVVCFYSNLLPLLCWVLKPCVKFSSSLFFFSVGRCRLFPLFVYRQVCFFVSFDFSIVLFPPFFIVRIHLETTKSIFSHQTWVPIWRMLNNANQIFTFSFNWIKSLCHWSVKTHKNSSPSLCFSSYYHFYIWDFIYFCVQWV